MAEIHPTDSYKEKHHRGSVLNDSHSVGTDGTGRYPGVEWAHPYLRQSGWNRGSYIGSRPLHMQGMGAFFDSLIISLFYSRQTIANIRWLKICKTCPF